MTEDKTILDTVGGTPLVRVDRVLPAEVKANGVRVLCKLEMQNPGASKRIFCFGSGHCSYKYPLFGGRAFLVLVPFLFVSE